MGIDMQEYLNDIMAELANANFFNKPFMTKEAMQESLIKVMYDKLDTTGSFYLSDMDLTTAYENACSLYVSDAIQKNLHEGLIEITGIDPNGELVYGITEAGHILLESNTSSYDTPFEEVGPFGSYCLN